MKGNTKRYNVNDIATILGISHKKVRNRAEKLSLIPEKIGSSGCHWYDFNQFTQIRNFNQEIYKADIINKNIQTIVHHVTWHIRDSKLNFLTLEQLPEWEK